MTSQPTKLSRSPLLTFALVVGFLGLYGTWTLLGTAPAPKQASGDPPTLVKHLRTELQSKDPVRRDHALVDIITLGRCTGSCTINLASVRGRRISIESESDVGAVVDLDALVPTLMTVYRSDPAGTGHRLLALSALISIGNQNALKALVEDIPSQPADVQSATHRSLAAFYLEKYPELLEKTERRRMLSIEDVERAERVRLRVARKDASE